MTMTPPRYERIISNLLDEVRLGKLLPGDKVPSEHQLAKQYAVSRITSRRALEELARMQVVERTQGRGTFISENAAQQAKPIKNGFTTIALVLPDFSDAFGLQMVYAIESRCAELGWYCIIKRTFGQQALEETTITELLKRGIDGFVIFPVHGEHYNPVLLKTVLEDFPIVLVDRYLPGIPASAVVSDNRSAAMQLTEHLIELGHTQIAFLSPPVLHTSPLEERLEGYNNALSRHHLKALHFSELTATLPARLKPENIVQDQHALQEFLETHPISAFVCSEYNLALEVHQFLTSRGKRIPHDYSIVCFDSPNNPLEPPHFTHIRQDETQIGQNAIDLINAKRQGQPSHTYRHVIPCLLVEGRSTRALVKPSTPAPRPQKK